MVRDRGRREVLSRSARAAITEIPETGGGAGEGGELNNKCICHSCGGWKPKIKVRHV